MSSADFSLRRKLAIAPRRRLRGRTIRALDPALGVRRARFSRSKTSPIMNTTCPIFVGGLTTSNFLRRPLSAGRPYNRVVSDRLLDVYIIGGESADPGAQMKLATLIATRYRVAAPSVADGLSGGFCLVGKQMPEAGAKKLADELRDLGATTKLQPAGVPLKITIKRSPDGRARKEGAGTRGGDTNAISGGFDRPPSAGGPMQLVEMGARIETSVRQAPTAVNKKTSEMIRCPLHGLTYDRMRASGCIRCLQPAREAARAIEGRAGGLNTDPVKRAFVGLAVAVLVGLVPAAYYAVGINGAEVKRLRARQAELSDQPGTKEITDEFDALDANVSQVRGRGVRNTLVVWLLVTGIAGFAWLKLAAPREAED